MSEQQAGGDQSASPKNYATVSLPPAEAQEALRQAQAQAAQPRPAYTDPTPSMYLGTPSTPLHMPDQIPEEARWQAPPPVSRLQSNTTLMIILGLGVLLLVAAVVLVVF